MQEVQQQTQQQMLQMQTMLQNQLKSQESQMLQLKKDVVDILTSQQAQPSVQSTQPTQQQPPTLESINIQNLSTPPPQSNPPPPPIMPQLVSPSQVTQQAYPNNGQLSPNRSAVQPMNSSIIICTI
ncbi:uncharacterized protein LOC142221581 [Haematobia irritans]|uniref:uncharacterized protein LOC142221581 n=1 Tax=Haematobia irritans TaxID=7368 RepID=UPI003F4F46E3